MSITTQAVTDGGDSSSRLSVPLALIDPGENVRELDDAHVDALAGSIALRGLIVPLLVRVNGGRYVLVAGEHRLAACRKLGVEEVEVTLRPQESSADGRRRTSCASSCRRWRRPARSLGCSTTASPPMARRVRWGGAVRG